MSTWLYGVVPNHPYFEQEKKIRQIVTSIKSELNNYVIKALLNFKNKFDINVSLSKSIEKKHIVWGLAIKTIKYGAIYWLSREDARKCLSILRNNKTLIDDISSFLKEDQKSTRIFNYAVHEFMRNKRAVSRFSNELIPKRAISSTGANQFYIRREDFFSHLPEESFNQIEPLYDLHDFSHCITASLSAELYGSHYFNSLIYLPERLRDLIKSKNYKSVNANPISDGIVFSQLSVPLYNSLAKVGLTDCHIVQKIADSLCDYYLGKNSLLHPATNRFIMLKKPITAIELATLVQNKAYELPASEMETRLFTRGGDDGHDPLKDLIASEIIEYLANCNDWLYFEKRNTLRHRAHKEAYKKVAYYLIQKSTNHYEINFLNRIIENIDYKDFYHKRRKNLWQELLNWPLPTNNDSIFYQTSKTIQTPMC